MGTQMRTLTAGLIAMLAWASVARAAALADTAALFPDLAVLELKREGVRIFYPAASAKPVKAPAAYLKSYEEAGVYASQPLQLDLGHGVPTATLTCDSGPSADPSCRLLARADDPGSTFFEASGKDFVFLANSDIHVFGQSDTLFDHRRLFRHDGRHYREIAQPYRYVGIDGRTTAALPLTAERGGDTARPVLTLPANAPLSILLNAIGNEDDNGQNVDYLVRSREGLVGWARVPVRPDGTTAIEGLRFAGD